MARLIRAATAVTRTAVALLRDFPRELSVQPENKVGEILFHAFAKSKAPRKNLWLRLRNHDALKQRPILFKHSLPMWSRLRYEVEDEEEFERRPLYKYHVRQHHLGLFHKLERMSMKSALPIPGGDVIEERGDDLLTQELNFYKPKRLRKLFDHLHKVELRPYPDYDFDFLLEPLEAGLQDDHRELRNEEYEDDTETGTANMPEEEEDQLRFRATTKDKEGSPKGEPANVMTVDEAKKILEAKVISEEEGKEVYDMEDLEKKYKLLFSLNDPAAGGSIYLALKIQAAYDKLCGKEIGAAAANKGKKDEKTDDRVEKLRAEQSEQKRKFNPDIKKVRIPNPLYIPQFWQDMNVEEKKLAEHVLKRLEPEMEWRDNMYEDGKRRKPQKIPEIHRDYY